MSKTLFVSSAVQAVLMKEIFIPELIDGFWKNHRPQGHGEVWRDVDVQVATPDGVLGPVGFEVPRNYNFLNPEFVFPNEERLVTAAQTAKPNSNFKSLKKELVELGQLVGGRLANREAIPVKLFRGNHREGTVTVSSSKARIASGTMVTTAVAPVNRPKKETVKKTVTKDENVTIVRGSQGGTVRRVAVKA